jgi:hypothetical protein
MQTCSQWPFAGTGSGAILTPDADFRYVVPESAVSAHASILWTVPLGGSCASCAAVRTDTRVTTVPGVGTGIFPSGMHSTSVPQLFQNAGRRYANGVLLFRRPRLRGP